MEGGSRTSRIRSLPRRRCRGFQTRSRAGTEVKGRSEVQISKTQFKSPGSLTSGKYQDSLRVYFTSKLHRVLGSRQMPPFIRRKLGASEDLHATRESEKTVCGMRLLLGFELTQGEGKGDRQGSFGGWGMSLPGVQSTRPSFLQAPKKGICPSVCSPSLRQ